MVCCSSSFRTVMALTLVGNLQIGLQCMFFYTCLYITVWVMSSHMLFWSTLSFTTHRMAQPGYVIVHVLKLVFLLQAVAGDCMDEGKPCDQCFQTLASHLLNTGDNKYQLQKTFYPPKQNHPVFVTVTYQFKDLCSGTSNSCSSVNISNCSDTNISSPCSDTNTANQNKTWFWNSGTFYFFQPLECFSSHHCF